MEILLIQVILISVGLLTSATLFAIETLKNNRNVDIDAWKKTNK